MKKIILASVVAVAAVSATSSAFASSATASVICAGTAGNGTSVVSAADNFVKTGFTPKCSANVHLAGQDGLVYYRVGSANVKGGRAFMGSTAGGAIASTACAAAVCTASDATAAATNASNATSG